jgi:hypothetical protein
MIMKLLPVALLCALLILAVVIVDVAADMRKPPKLRKKEETLEKYPPPRDKKRPNAAEESAPPASAESAFEAQSQHKLHPHYQHYDVTRGNLHHAAIAEVNAIHEALEDAKRRFLAARESESAAQIRKLCEEAKALVERHSTVCSPIADEAGVADRESTLLRDEMAMLNENLRVAIITPALVEKSTSLAGRLRESEERFATATTMSHVCMNVGANLEQLRIETHFAAQSLGVDL